MQQRLALARRIAREAGDLTLKYFYHLDTVNVERKADATPVTIADKEAELLLRQRISEAFPEDSILGEEFPSKDGTSGFQWLLDPIDGTKSFIHCVPLYSTLIGITRDRTPLAGVIALPALHELVWAGKGLGTWHETEQRNEARRVRVSACGSISEALFLTSEVKTFDETGRTNAYKNLERSVRLSRTWGDAFGYVMVATGRAEIMVDPALSDWDAGPLQIVLEEAGGTFTDWKGNPTIYGKEGIASNGILHQAVLEIVNTFN
jgi:histidinol phosphatase-like enzyme (inositol monophosphatase family)